MLKKFCMSLMAAFLLFSVKVSAAEFEMVSYSAQVKLQWLANIGVPEAKKILKQIGTANIYDKTNLPDYERLEKLNGVYQELSYASTIDFVRKNNFMNVMDIGGGYSPRAVVFAKEGRKYIGAELTAVAMSATEIMPDIAGKKYAKNISYENVPVEDREAMIGTADRLDGQICIIENGLMIYLTKERADTMFTLIRQILKAHGGCYITSDFVTKEYFKEIAAVLYGDYQAQLLYDETKVMYEELFGSEIFDDTFETQAEAIEFLKAHGLKVTQIPLLTDTSKLYCTKKLTAEQNKKIKQIAAKNYLWVITAE